MTRRNTKSTTRQRTRNEYLQRKDLQNKEQKFIEQGTKIYKDLMNKEQIFTEQGTILTKQRTKRELYVAR